MEQNMIFMQGITYIIMGVIFVASFLVGRYVFPEIKNVVGSTLNLLSAYPMLQKWGVSACQYIAQYFSDISGEEKNKKAAEIIMQVAQQVGLTITEEQARSIAQAAFEAMEKGVYESEKEGASTDKEVKENA